ncbi:MAG: helix-turn-helix domain-containing protein [Prolixibacteraceae bacterium]|jgi:transposase|nr:helix-turn-helix domain-containing protein [Prolixibacteraceae bacterium]
MKDKSEIIRLRNYEGLSEREISRRLGFSRITVHRILSEYTKALKDQEGKKSRMEEYILTPPIYKTENRSKRRLNEDIIRIIDHCLEENEIKKRSGRHKQRMLKQDIHELLVEQGHDISYSTVCGYISNISSQKGHVERTVEVLRRKDFCVKDTFDTSEQAIEHLHQTCRKLNATEDIKPKLEKDLRSLLPYTTPMGCFVRRELKVDKWSTITLNTSHYSVPDTLVGRITHNAYIVNERRFF